MCHLYGKPKTNPRPTAQSQPVRGMLPPCAAANTLPAARDYKPQSHNWGSRAVIQTLWPELVVT